MTGNCPSAGDFSKLLATLQGDDDDPFIRAVRLHHIFDLQLLVDHVKTHPLFESISHLWHPPLPGPPEVSLDPDTSLDATLSPRITSSLDGTSQSSGGENQLDSIQQVSPSSSLKITWPVLREGLLADDPINLTADPSNFHSLHDTTSIPAHTSEDAEDVQDDVDEDGTNSQASPLQPFPQLRTQEQDQEVNPHPDTATNSISEAKVGDTNSSDLNLKGESEDVEIWNPWIPRPADGPMYASESLASRLPNPYSPQPALSHHLESARDFQSLQCISSVDSQPKLEENLLAATSETKPPQRIIMKNDTPSDELATADHDSAREDTGGPDMQIPGFKTPPIRLIATRLHSNPPLVSSSTPTAEEDIMFFNASKQTRSKSLSILSKGRNGGRSFPRFSLSARSLSSPSDANHTSVDLPRSVEAGIESPQKDTEDITNKSGRTGKAKNRFSLPISFPNPRIKQANGDQQEQRHPWHKRRFSAPLLLKSKGPPSSFHTVKIRSQINPVSLLNMPVPPSDIAPMSKNKTSSTVSPALSSGISLAGANILPFSAQELDRMRLEYQKRRATDPIPMPRIRADNSHYTEFATFGRSSGSRMLMMAQARASATANAMRRNCQSEEGARHPSSVAPRVKHGHSRSQSQSSSRTGVLCPSLQDELTMSVLSALNKKSGESRDFTTMTTVRSSRTYRSRGRLEISAPMRVHSLHQGRSEPRLDDGHESESVSVLAQAGTLRGTNRASWAGMMGSHHNIQHPSGPEELQRRSKKDPPCPPPMSRDYFNSTNQLSPGPARASVEEDGKTVCKRRSLRSRLWKKFKQLAFL
ncbi:hypothetical protein C8R42DRAFT_678894 [Lentinula raphanica]|nr:hypothetical protein C8R42DRAFT_678894 [Lentinula raphanica]